VIGCEMAVLFATDATAVWADGFQLIGDYEGAVLKALVTVKGTQDVFQT
jgi:hypothetical protein